VRLPSRIPILYLMLSVLVLVSVVPLWVYGAKMVADNRDKLKTNERLLQNTITSSLGDDIAQRQNNLAAMLASLVSALQISSGGNLSGDHVSAPELRALVQEFVSNSSSVVYATLLNTEKKGISAGRMRAEELDAFMQLELERGFTAAAQARAYNGQALAQGAGKSGRTLMLVSVPVMAGGNFVGMIGAFVDLQFIGSRLREVSQGGLEAYVVDHQGRLVAAATGRYATGQDMTRLDIVKNFVEQGQNVHLAAITHDFTMHEGNRQIAMLGTYRAVAPLDWAVVAQKPQDEAYRTAIEMQRTAQWFAVLLVALSIAISVAAARRITTPLATLTESSRAIARGDFSRRVELTSRTEIGELASTFNHMTDDLERFVFDLKRAAEENHALFLGSIQMLAGAVDEKDPYTRGHSDRVTRYSVLLAVELGIIKEEVEQIRIAAQLHDVGKIGIEDRILKKPGALTPDEYEIMKTHTSKGANILRPVVQLQNMLPGIELHHESLDGRGYPLGLKGDELPLMARIITVADTFDAMTTNRPYQAAMDPEYVVRVITSLVDKKFDARVVAALQSVFQKGEFRIRRAAVVSAAQAAAAAAAAAPADPRTGVISASVDTERI
jgi:HD-GYP domain-containing protein (c-di-GMP phosphodiesterase class II)